MGEIFKAKSYWDPRGLIPEENEAFLTAAKNASTGWKETDALRSVEIRSRMNSLFRLEKDAVGAALFGIDTAVKRTDAAAGKEKTPDDVPELDRRAEWKRLSDILKLVYYKKVSDGESSFSEFEVPKPERESDALYAPYAAACECLEIVKNLLPDFKQSVNVAQHAVLLHQREILEKNGLSGLSRMSDFLHDPYGRPSCRKTRTEAVRSLQTELELYSQNLLPTDKGRNY